MIQHNCAMICKQLDHLAAAGQNMLDRGQEVGEATQLTDDERKLVLKAIGPVGAECSRLELTDAVRRGLELQARLQGDFGSCSFGIVHSELEGFRRAIIDELKYRKFAFISPIFAPYFEQEKLFGEKVYDNFEITRREIKDAGNCLAADLGTAAVFHLMRTAEFGMRALARERHIKIKHRELEYADWQDIISALGKKAEDVSNWRGRSAGKAAALALYRGAVRQLEGFKEEWRNHVMHTRQSYDFNQAVSVFDRVKEFMQRLASAGLSEKQSMSINWKKHKP